MTCIEKLRIEHPDLIKLADELHNRPVGYFGCPHMFKYAPRPINCDPRTFREKLMLEHPEQVSPKWSGGCYGCPHTYGYLAEGRCEYDCYECWDREIPGTENIKKENDIMPVNAIHTREVTKEDLLREIKAANEHIHRMENEIKNLERYKGYEGMANEFKAMHTAFMNSGFSDEQAFEMVKTITESSMPAVLRSVGL